MKKSIAKFLTFAALTGMLTCSTALAADEIKYSKDDDGNINVTVTVTAAAEETTLLVIPTETTIEQAFEKTELVYYINQAAADSSGVAHFKFNAPAEGSYTIYSGYATMKAEDVPLEKVIEDLSTGPVHGKDFTYGDVNNDSDVDVIDASAIINNYLSGTAFTDISTGETYRFGVNAADVNGDSDIDIVDASAVINNYLSGAVLPVLSQQ